MAALFSMLSWGSELLKQHQGVGLIKFEYVARMYVLFPSGVEHATLDQGCSLLRSGYLESTRGTQAMIRHRGKSIVFFHLII